jgi:hypothetical protein
MLATEGQPLVHIRCSEKAVQNTYLHHVNSVFRRFFPCLASLAVFQTNKGENVAPTAEPPTSIKNNMGSDYSK